MKTVGDVLNSKGREVWTVSPDASVRDVVRVLKDRRIGAVLVMDAEAVKGIVSERDCALDMLLSHRDPKTTLAKDIMSRKVVCVGPDKTVDEAMALVTDKRVRHLPVVEGDQVIGIISIGDLVKAIISDQQFMIEQLERYITS